MEIVTATHCLDACAVIAYLRNERGADILKDVIEQPQTFLAIHICNLGEVYYDFFRDAGLQAAQTAWNKALELPLTLRRDTDAAFIQRVGVIEVEQRVSFADAFALALAERLSVPLVTTDHHEFDPIEQEGHFQFLWLPRGRSPFEQQRLGLIPCVQIVYSDEGRRSDLDQPTSNGFNRYAYGQVVSRNPTHLKESSTRAAATRCQARRGLRLGGSWGGQSG